MLLCAGGVEPAKPPRKKSVKAEAEEGGEAAVTDSVAAAPKPGSKKRGRPPTTAYMAGAGGVPNFPPNAAALNGAGAAGAAGSLVGSRVEGIVDGTFDLGYFLTVRINGTNQARERRAATPHSLLRCPDTRGALRAAFARARLPPGALRRRPGAVLAAPCLP